MVKCLIFNTDENYVRTKNFIENTKELFEHIIIKYNEPKTIQKTNPPHIYLNLSKIPCLYYISKIHALYKLRKKRLLKDWVYVPNLDPLLVTVCNLFNVNVISDILEPYPEMYSNKFARIFYNMLEKITVKKSKIILTVTEEETSNLKKKYKVNNIYTIKNFPELVDFNPVKKKFDNFSVVYMGFCVPSRDLTNVTKAIKQLQKKYNIEMHIIGDKKLLSQTFCKYKYHGWLNHNKASKIISKCHVGVSPYKNNLHCNLTLQNKAFQYAACNVLPLSTDLKPLHKYKKLIRLIPNNKLEDWYGELKRDYVLWKNNNLKFNQRKLIIKNNWLAKNEWGKLNKIIGIKL